MRSTLRSAAAIVLLALPAMAAPRAYETPQNRLLVVPLNATDIEVIEDYGEGPRGMWCAAANYIDRYATHARTGDLYVKSPRGPSLSGAGRVGVVFTIDAENLGADPFKAYSVGVDTAGQALPVQHAYQFCRDYIIDFNDILYRHGGRRP